MSMPCPPEAVGKAELRSAETLGQGQASAVELETVSKIPLEDLAADPRQLQIVERSMDRRQSFITDLQSPRLSDPRQRPLYDPTDLAQPTSVGRTRPRQMVLDPSLLEPLLVA